MKYQFNKETITKHLNNPVLTAIIMQMPDVFELEDDKLRATVRADLLLNKTVIDAHEYFTPMFGYELLQDTVKTKAGAKFVFNQCYYQNIESLGRSCGHGLENFDPKDVENNPEWFKKFGQ